MQVKDKGKKMATTTKAFQTPAGGVAISPTGQYQVLGKIDVTSFDLIRVVVDNDTREDTALIDLIILNEDGFVVPLDGLISLLGAGQANRVYEIPGTELTIMAAVIGTSTAHIQVAIWGTTLGT